MFVCRQRRKQELERKERELADQGKLNREEFEKFQDERKKLCKLQKQLGLQVPPYWKNKTGINFVATNFVRDALQKFMVESSCCPATKQTRVVSVERVENEYLWQMYQ